MSVQIWSRCHASNDIIRHDRHMIQCYPVEV
uniref:Uncharacterized protein n=1 Tax=Anopheles arabiensis TaxID=7173 RepID=A0A182IFL4_ANOAR